MTKPNAKPSPTAKPKEVTVVVYGLDGDNKPQAAQFLVVDREQGAKAAAASDLEIVAVTTKALQRVAAMLPVGQVDKKGHAIVPHVEMALYRKLFDVLALSDQTSADPRKPTAAIATGLPETWDQIAPGHLVIAQESLDYGWAEAVVLERNGETLKLRFRDYPSLPKFTRPVIEVALLTTAPADGGPS